MPERPPQLRIVYDPYSLPLCLPPSLPDFPLLLLDPPPVSVPNSSTNNSDAHSLPSARWTYGLELVYQAYDRQTWPSLQRDEENDVVMLRIGMLNLRTLDNCSILFDPAALPERIREEEEICRAVERRRGERWRRLYALHGTRALFLESQRAIFPGEDEAFLLSRIPAGNLVNPPQAPHGSLRPLDQTSRMSSESDSATSSKSRSSTVFSAGNNDSNSTFGENASSSPESANPGILTTSTSDWPEIISAVTSRLLRRRAARA